MFFEGNLYCIGWLSNLPPSKVAHFFYTCSVSIVAWLRSALVSWHIGTANVSKVVPGMPFRNGCGCVRARMPSIY